MRPTTTSSGTWEYELMGIRTSIPSDIGAAVKDGAVTLSGFARSFRQRAQRCRASRAQRRYRLYRLYRLL